MWALVVSVLFVLTGASTFNDTEAPGERQRALHALNRLAFGPRPGDVERVVAMGVDRWIDQQLHPERIPDAQVEAKLASFEILSMSDDELYENFEKPYFERRRELAKQKGGDGEAAARPVKLPPEQRPRRIVEELSAAKVVRAVESNRQIDEVMAAFRANHFNV